METPDNLRPSGSCAAPCSAWWIRGAVTIKGTKYEARKHKVFRYVQGYSWGWWTHFCDPKKARKLFEPNANCPDTGEAR